MAEQQEAHLKPVTVSIKNLGRGPRIFFDANNNPFEVLPNRTVEQSITQGMLDQLGKMVENGDKLEVNGKVSEAVQEEQDAELEEAKKAQERAAVAREEQEALAEEQERNHSAGPRAGHRRPKARPGQRGGRHTNNKDE